MPCALSRARFPKKQKKEPEKTILLKKKIKRGPREKIGPLFLHAALITQTGRPPTAICGLLRFLVHRYRYGPSSRVRASAESARCQPAFPSKVDRTDEAAL